jgi:PAS domain S-box-containing protein
MNSRYNRTPQPFIALHSVSSILTAAILTTILCYLASQIGGILVVRPQMLWPVWPGCALLVALLLLTRQKIWPILITAGFAGFMLNDLLGFGMSIRSSSVLILGDTIEVLVAALGTRYFFGDVVRLNDKTSLAKYFLVAVIIAPIFAAFVSATAFQGSYWTYWGVAVLTEGLALLTVTPAVLGIVRALMRWRYESHAHFLEAMAIMLALFVLGYITFISSGVDRPELLYSLVPFLLWSALRFGLTGTSLSIMVIAFLAIWGAVHGHGPFVGQGTMHDVISLQLFLLFAATSFMFLAAFVEEDRQGKEALQESEEKFRSVFRDAGVGMVVVSTEGHFLAANETFCSCLGYSEQELLGKTVESVTFPEDWPAFSERLRAALVEGRVFQRFEKRCLHKSGRIVYTESTASLIRSSEGNAQYFVGEVSDITKRKEAEEVLSGVNRKLIEAQERERVRIARELHDDIAQRLALLAVELDQIRLNNQTLPSEILSQVQELQKQTADLTTDVQSMSHNLHSSKVEILGLIGAVKATCKEFGQLHKMEIDFTSHGLNAHLPAAVSLGIFRVLQEALQNAAKHSGVKHVEVQLREHPDEIHLVVSDLGKGFDLDSATKGRGLGLTSMQERVRVLNGTILIQSKPMGGTTIYVRVPFESNYAARSAV